MVLHEIELEFDFLFEIGIDRIKLLQKTSNVCISVLKFKLQIQGRQNKMQIIM